MASLDLTKPLKWNKAREEAARLLAEGDLTDHAIAKLVGYTRQQIWAWQKHPQFRDRIADHIAAWKERIRTNVWNDRERRLQVYIEDVRRIDTTIAAIDIILTERGSQVKAAAAEEHAEASEGPINYAGGASTGYITRDYRGKNDRVVYQFDAPLMREKRELLRTRAEILKQLAIELGQWNAEKETDDGRLNEIVALMKARGPDAEPQAGKTAEAAPTAQDGEEKK